LLRAADVTLRKKKNWILVRAKPPLSLIHVKNWNCCCWGRNYFAGNPSFYAGAKTIVELAGHSLSRACWITLGVRTTCAALGGGKRVN